MFRTKITMKTNLIIATLNRHNNLKCCLNSISKLNQSFDEIIIVEQGDIAKTKTVIAEFNNLNISLYFHSVKSLAQARNFGIEKSSGNLVFFIDDDVELIEKNYINIALNYFNSHPKVMGLTGNIAKDMQIFNRSWRLKFYDWFFLLNGRSFNISASGFYQNNWGKVSQQSCQWLPGCNMAYRRQVFEQGFRFNERFIRWSSGEDIMFSHQIYQFYGKNSLMYLPQFCLHHFEEKGNSINEINELKMQIIYGFIFWQELIYQKSTFNAMCYLHSQIGLLLLSLYPKRLKSKPYAFKTLLKSYYFLLKNHKKIINNQINYNQFILDND
ncbi:MAG: glycosyltransferase [Candidatus Thioglobus sp.]|nr:MAG: glycosyltransferase [Candidatus Thioglobus sp.]KAA0446027.1 MAG: glycosyltransferase [Candidatus Thioglobus sp.]